MIHHSLNLNKTSTLKWNNLLKYSYEIFSYKYLIFVHLATVKVQHERKLLVMWADIVNDIAYMVFNTFSPQLIQYFSYFSYFYCSNSYKIKERKTNGKNVLRNSFSSTFLSHCFDTDFKHQKVVFSFSEECSLSLHFLQYCH